MTENPNAIKENIDKYDYIKNESDIHRLKNTISKVKTRDTGRRFTKKGVNLHNLWRASRNEEGKERHPEGKRGNRKRYRKAKEI